MADARIRSHSPHDVKTDLSIISAALQLAARRLADDPELHAALRSAIDRAHRLARGWMPAG